MARFVIFDQSLTGVGGHHFEQAVQLLRAADQFGCEPVLVTHLQFTQFDLFPPHWTILPRFADASYDCLSEYPIDLQGVPLPAAEGRSSGRDGRGAWGRMVHAVASGWRIRHRRGRIERFADACEQVDEELMLRGTDRVILPTASLFDLLGLARFFQTARRLPTVTFHVLFHHGFLTGRQPEYAEQWATERNVRRQMDYLLRNVPRGQLRFYGITQRVADQFNRLSLARFDVLPFPVESSDSAEVRDVPSTRPLRMTCAGLLRREKGKAVAAPLVRSLWGSELQSGRVQMVIQTNRRQARRIVPPGASRGWSPRPELPLESHDPIIWLRHPLDRDAYLRALRNSDIALFLHDGRAYYSRCSGVLTEMLAAGVPVLVPAGSWLSDQVAESIYQHLDEVPGSVAVVDHFAADQLTWERSALDVVGSDAPPATFVCGGEPHAAICRLTVPPGAASLWVALRWDDQGRGGTYLRLATRAIGGEGGGESWNETTTVLTPREGELPASTVIPLEPGAREVHLFVSNAYDDGAITVQPSSVKFLAQACCCSQGYPVAKVGLIYSHVSQIPAMVREIREHYAHYRDSARAFAAQWGRDHDAREIVARITAKDADVERAAA